MKLAQRISAWLAKETPWFIAAVAVVTYLDEVTFAGTLPPLFAWVRGNLQSTVLGIIMLTMGMTLTKDDFKVLVSHPIDIAIGSLSQFSIMPLVALGLTHLLNLPKEIAVGLILVGCSPGGVSSNIMSFLCKGDVAFSVGITSLSTLLAPLTTPLLMHYLAGERVEVDAVGMFKSILFLTLLPIAIGFTVNALCSTRAWFAEFKKLLPGLAVLALACIVGGTHHVIEESRLPTGCGKGFGMSGEIGAHRGEMACLYGIHANGGIVILRTSHWYKDIDDII